MDNKSISMNLVDLRAIINSLDHIIADEIKSRSRLKNPDGLFGKMYYETHSKNILYATDCKECLSFVLDALPKLIENFEEMNLFNYKQKEIKTLNRLNEYKYEFKKLKMTIDTIEWETNLKGKFTGINNGQSLECVKKFEQAYKAFNEIVKLNKQLG